MTNSIGKEKLYGGWQWLWGLRYDCLAYSARYVCFIYNVYVKILLPVAFHVVCHSDAYIIVLNNCALVDVLVGTYFAGFLKRFYFFRFVSFRFSNMSSFRFVSEKIMFHFSVSYKYALLREIFTSCLRDENSDFNKI
jgi:hypothetical protein